MAPYRFDSAELQTVFKGVQESTPKVDHGAVKKEKVIFTDVLIAGSGPIGAAYARNILEKNQDAKVLMCEIGSQDSPVIGAHHKNSIKYQKDIDAFVNVIKGALQTVSVPPGDTFIPTLGGDAWAPSPTQTLIFQGNNPNQDQRLNLKASAVTRSVGGMATHWTCACPVPHDEERKENPIPKEELDKLLERSRILLNVHPDQYDQSIRHRVVRQALLDNLPKERNVQNLPLAVQRRQDNPEYVTWSGTNTILDKYAGDTRFQLKSETRVTRLIASEGKIWAAQIRDLRTDSDMLVFADAYVVACGAVGTPQILSNSHNPSGDPIDVGGPALGRYLCEQSLAFCQIVLRSEIIKSIWDNPEFKKKVEEHKKHHPTDPLPIPFSDPEPQVMIPYTDKHPWHVQVHRDAFSYGDVGPRADSRVVVDLRFFGKQTPDKNNYVFFGPKKDSRMTWYPGVTDIYGMPQATFEVERSQEDLARDHKMMKDMTDVANILGGYLPGSQPQFMEPGLALHITGTTRIGNDPQTSVADPSSKVHGFSNLWVGGNGCIPDSTCSNPTRTSVAIALKGADCIVEHLKTIKK